MLLNPLIERKYRFAVRPKKHRPGRTRGGFKVKLRFQSKAGIRYFHDSLPISKESQIRALEKANTNKAVLEQSKQNIIMR